MIPNQRNPVVAVEIRELLETCTNLKKDFAETGREYILVPV